MKKLLLLLFAGLTLLGANQVEAQRQMEKLDRGVVAVNRGNDVFISWLMQGTEPENIGFNIYRNVTKITSEPITESTNYVDDNGKTGDTYYVTSVIDGNESVPSKTVEVWSEQYKSLPLQTPDGYTPNDASVGDLDGDGEYEIVLHQTGTGHDNAHSGFTDPPILQAYKLDGTFLWEINLGINIREGAHYTQFMVYDFDGDGIAEIACKTAPGTKDGTDGYLSKGPAADADHQADYRNDGGYILSGPEYLTVFSGETGEELATTDYVPPRGNVSSWGDNYGNRVDRFLAAVAYLDGEKPSLVMARGYYTRTVLAAWDWDGQNLTHRWTFDSDDSGNEGYAGQGAHSLSVGDVDSDGADEIMYGACAIDHDGTGLYTTGYGHGDATHLGDFDPDREGLEFFMPHEGNVWGISYRDAGTGEMIFDLRHEGDVGRGVAADVYPGERGAEFWGLGTYNSKGEEINISPSSTNFLVYWDDDPQRELLNGETIDNMNSRGNTERLLTAYNFGASANNGSKSNPSLSADILGDWREEVIWRHHENDRLLIFTTTIPTKRKNYTLMHDPIYRLSIAWQNVAYNQPPHTGFYFADGAPTPNIELIERDMSAMSYGNFYLNPVHSNMALDVTDDISQQEPDESGNQVWRFTKQDGGYEIFSYVTEQYLTLDSVENGADVTFADASDKQLFDIVKDGENDQYFLSPAENETLVLTISESSVDAGGQLILADKADTDNQKFTFANAGNKLDCNSDWDGTAYYDNCGICVSGNTGIEGNSESFEAGYYKIKPVVSGLCMEAGSSMYQTDCKDDISQTWEITKDGIFYKIKPRGSDKVVGYLNNQFYFGSLSIDAKFRIEEYTNESGEVSYVVTKPDGEYIFSIEDNSQDPDAKLTLVSRTETGNRNFILEKLPIDEDDCNGDWKGSAYIDDCGNCVGGNTGEEPCISDMGDGFYRIKPVNSNLCLEPGNGIVIQDNCISENSQLWAFDSDGAGNFKIRNAETNEYMYTSSTETLTEISMSSASTDFNLEKTENGDSYYISPASNSEVLFDVYNVSSDPGAKIIYWTDTGADNQKFILESKGLFTVDDNVMAEEDNIKLFPNPVKEQLNLILQKEIANNARYELYNASGDLLKAQPINTETTNIQMGTFSSGLYFLKVFNGEKTYTLKVSKN